MTTVRLRVMPGLEDFYPTIITHSGYKKAKAAPPGRGL